MRKPGCQITRATGGKKLKKLNLALAVVCVVTILAGPVAADTITGITLYGGNGSTSWSWNGQGWTTTNTGWYVLGVSSTPNGTLANQSDTTITVPFDQHYWLYADPTFLGATPKVEVTTVEKGMLTTIFTRSGSAGTESPWSVLQGSTLLQLGWASGSADKVGQWHQMTANGTNDFYLHLQAGAPVPIPGAVWLLGSGLLGLWGFRRKFLG